MADSDLRLYDVTVGSHRTAMRLNERDALAYGDSAVLAGEQNPAGVVTPTAPAVPAEPDTKSRLITSNKMRGVDDPAAHPVPGKPEGAK